MLPTVRKTCFLALLLLLALGMPGQAQEGPSARVKSYLATLAKAKTLAQVRPYFSKEFWDYTYAPLADAPASEQAQLLAETARDLKGFSVKGEQIKGATATVSIADPNGEETPLAMIKENGVWVIDLDAGPDSGEEEE